MYSSAKFIQCKKDFIPWMTNEFKIPSEKRNELHKKALETKHPDDWRLYKNQQNKVNKINFEEKKKHYKKRLNWNNKNTTNDSPNNSQNSNYGLQNDGKGEFVCSQCGISFHHLKSINDHRKNSQCAKKNEDWLKKCVCSFCKEELQLDQKYLL